MGFLLELCKNWSITLKWVPSHCLGNSGIEHRSGLGLQYHYKCGYDSPPS